MKRVLSQAALSLVIVIFVVNELAMKLYWYSAIHYFDKPMHFLGGVFLALATDAFLSKRLIGKRFGAIVQIILISVFLLGLVWEFFEYVVQAYAKFNMLVNVPDSISDLLF